MAVSESSNPPALLGQALLNAIREAVKEAIRETSGNGHYRELLDPEELAIKLKVPISWVYEQSRQAIFQPTDLAVTSGSISRKCLPAGKKADSPPLP